MHLFSCISVAALVPLEMTDSNPIRRPAAPRQRTHQDALDALKALLLSIRQHVGTLLIVDDEPFPAREPPHDPLHRTVARPLVHRNAQRRRHPP